MTWIRNALACVLILAWATSCIDWPCPVCQNEPPMVSLQITEYKDAGAFERIVSELEARGIKATILVGGDFAAANCQRLLALDAAGCEIMAFARPTLPDGSSTTMSNLSYEEQYAHVAGIKAAIEGCLGKPVHGFRCTRFDQNEDTYAVVNALGFRYNLGFVAGTTDCMPGHEDDTLPFWSYEYGFWAVPMHSSERDGRLTAFCDNPFEDLPAQEWEALLQSEFDRMDDQDRPLLVEFHPYFSGVDEGRFQAFVNLLDYAISRNARFLTVGELADWSIGAAAGGADGTDGGDTPCPND